MSNAATLDIARTIISDMARSKRIKLTSVRLALADLTRAEQDAALIQLQRDGMIVLYRNDNTPSLTPADHSAALIVAGFPRHLMYVC